MARVCAPGALTTPLTVSDEVASVTVHCWLAPRMTGALIPSVVAPVARVMPNVADAGVMVSVPPLPGAMLTALVRAPPSKVRVLMVSCAPLRDVARLFSVAFVV